MRFTKVSCTCLTTLLTAVVAISFVQQKTFAAKCPCDIYATGGTPCVAAHSTVRALYSTYAGPLYQVKRTSDNQTFDISVLTPGGVANAAVQDSFLAGKPGTISKIYDQSPNGNHLVRCARGGWLKVPAKEASATGAKIMINGRSVYGIYTTGNGFSSDSTVVGVGYRNNKTTGVVTGNGAEGIYEVVDGKHVAWGCCFDYGNVQTSSTDNGNSSMETIYFGTSNQWGHGSGNGPWVMNDCENGIQAGVDPAGSKSWAGNTSIIANYVTGVVKSKNTDFYAIRGGDATTGKLKTMYSGIEYPGWYPKKLEGAIALGVGGDNSNTGEGTFFEGAMTNGMPSDTIDDSIQANIIAAGYGKTTIPPVATLNSVKEESPASMLKVHYNQLTANAYISYTLKDTRLVSMTIVDQRGRQVSSIVNGVFGAGRHEVTWNTSRVPAGVYVCRVAIDGRDGWSGKIVIGK